MSVRAKWLGLLALAGVLAVGAYLTLRTPTESYKPIVAGIVTARRDGPAYKLAGREGWVEVDRFLNGNPAGIGDLVLAGDGTRTWVFVARASGVGCWKVTGEGLAYGQTVDVDTGPVHLVLQKAPDFSDPSEDGKLLGTAICLDS